MSINKSFCGHNTSEGGTSSNIWVFKCLEFKHFKIMKLLPIPFTLLTGAEGQAKSWSLGYLQELFWSI